MAASGETRPDWRGAREGRVGGVGRMDSCKLGGAKDLGDGAAFPRTDAEQGLAASEPAPPVLVPFVGAARSRRLASRKRTRAIRGRDEAVREAESARTVLAETAERSVTAAGSRIRRVRSRRRGGRPSIATTRSAGGRRRA